MIIAQVEDIIRSPEGEETLIERPRCVVAPATPHIARLCIVKVGSTLVLIAHDLNDVATVAHPVAFSGETARQQLGYTLGGRYGLDLGCYASLLHDQLQLSLSLSNLLHSRDRLTMRMGDTTEQLRLNLSPRRRLVLTISYAFSAGDQVKPVRTESAATLSLERPVL